MLLVIANDVKFKLGEIAKINITLQNIWNQKITNIICQTKITNQQKNILTTHQAPTANIKARSQKTVIAYLDTKNIKPGKYNLTIELQYQNQKTTKEKEIYISKNKIDLDYQEKEEPEKKKKLIPITLTVITIILTTTIIIWLIRKKKKYP